MSDSVPSDTSQPASGNARFNNEAAKWDANPLVHILSAEAWKALQKNIPALQDPAGKRLDVLEIGCGTGLLTFLVAPSVREIVAVDAAEGMIRALESKVAASGSTNIVPLAILLEDPEDERLPPASQNGKNDSPRRKFDLIISHLVLHHIPDLKAVLTTMFGCLKPGGTIALTDFEDFGPEAKRFHPESKMEGVERHGINARWIGELIAEVGFQDIRVEVAWEHEKRVERWPGEFVGGRPEGEGQGEVMRFSYLICMGRRPGGG
ncbi:methyltransferase [subsurface metagenome]